VLNAFDFSSKMLIAVVIEHHRRKRLQLVQHENDCTAADTQLQQAAQRWLGTAVGVILRNWNDLASLQAKEDHNNVMSTKSTAHRCNPRAQAPL
jgi:hypothetical protein